MTIRWSLVVLFALWSAPALAEQPIVLSPPTVQAAPSLPKERVLQNFFFLCAQCHGEQGDATGPNASKQFEVLPADLTDGDYMAKFTDQQIFRTLTFGGPANNLSSLMPPWGNRLSEAERWELVRYIRTLCRCEGIGGPHQAAP